MKHVVLLLAPGFEEIEAVTVLDVLRRADIKTSTFAVAKDIKVTGAHGLSLNADQTLDHAPKNLLADMLVLPGGQPGANHLRDDASVQALIKKHNQENKFIAAICAAPIALAKSINLQARHLTCYPGFEGVIEEAGAKIDTSDVVQDQNIITGKGPAAAMAFALKCVEVLTDSEMSMRIEKALRAEG